MFTYGLPGADAGSTYVRPLGIVRPALVITDADVVAAGARRVPIAIPRSSPNATQSAPIEAAKRVGWGVFVRVTVAVVITGLLSTVLDGSRQAVLLYAYIVTHCVKGVTHFW
jgi:hypothetical protein